MVEVPVNCYNMAYMECLRCHKIFAKIFRKRITQWSVAWASAPAHERSDDLLERAMWESLEFEVRTLHLLHFIPAMRDVGSQKLGFFKPVAARMKRRIMQETGPDDMVQALNP